MVIIAQVVCGAYGIAMAACFIIGLTNAYRVLGKMPASKEELVRVARDSKSTWDPFNEKGAKKWNRIFLSLFVLLVVFAILAVRELNGLNR